MRKLLFILGIFLLFAAPVFGGDIGQDKDPTHIDTKMYTLEQIYQKVAKGTTPDSKTAGFHEPTSGPGSTMYTLDAIEAKIAAGTTDATINDVLKGKTFISRSGTGDGGETHLTGNYECPGGGAFGLPRTGQTTEYQVGDDGTYHAGKPAYPAAQCTDTPGTTNSVTDNGTGLIWVKNEAAIGSVGGYDFTVGMSWYDALLAIAALNASNGGAGYDGFNQWRLPNVKELQSIVDYSRVGPSIDPIFTSQSGLYWSSTTDADDTDYAWYVSFCNGYVSSANKDGDYGYVRPVRGGQ